MRERVREREKEKEGREEGGHSEARGDKLGKCVVGR